MGIWQMLGMWIALALSSLMVGLLTVTRTEGPSFKIGGFGFVAVFTNAWDNSYLTGGEVADLSATFLNEVFGGKRISASLNDGNRMAEYVRDGDATGASGAPAVGTIQLYQTGAAVNGVFIQTPSAEDVSALNNEYWIFYGR